MRPLRILRARRAALAFAAGLAWPVGAAMAQHADHSTHTTPPAERSERDGASASESDRESNAPAAHDHLHHGAAPQETGAHSDHAAMGHDAAAKQTPREPIPPITDVDRAAAFPDAGEHPPHGTHVFSYVSLNRLEAFDADPGAGFTWEGQGWIGGDRHKLWLRSEGERADGATESADLEVLYGRGIARWWDLIAGVRHDFKPGDAQTFAAVGVQGLAPMKFEVEATAYLGERGQSVARIEAEYELLLTNRLILQPLIEIGAYGKNDPARGIGAGLGTLEAGLRLRYEFTRRFAPYVGVVHERAFGNTADFRRDDGEDIDDTRVVFGIRTWF